MEERTSLGSFYNGRYLLGELEQALAGGHERCKKGSTERFLYHGVTV